MLTDEQMRYPVGKFVIPLTYTGEDIAQWTEILRTLPAKVRNAVAALNEDQLDTPYRTDGWTIRQVVHHIPDSHMNALIRFKWTLTEDNPTIKPYKEDQWALLSDYKMPVEPSLKLLEAIHIRMINIIEGLGPDELELSFIHPDTGQTIPLKRLIALYAWHSEHHLAHITETVKKF